jgi:hypothetical protein
MNEKPRDIKRTSRRDYSVSTIVDEDGRWCRISDGVGSIDLQRKEVLHLRDWLNRWLAWDEAQAKRRRL